MNGTFGPIESGYVMGTRRLSGSSVSFHYDWVDPISSGANVISFKPADFSNVTLGQTFVLGTLSYQNGFWYGAGESAPYNTPVELGFRIQTVSNDGPAFNQTLVSGLRNMIHAVPNDAGFQHQTNTLVYSAGNYRFSDFARLEVPMNLITWVAASLLIPLFWPFQPG